MTTVDHLKVHFAIVHDCIRSSTYALRLRGSHLTPNAALTLADICASHAVISWSMLFGNWGEQTHWKKFSECFGETYPERVTELNADRFAKATGLSPKQWMAVHKQLSDFRNKRLAHFDLDATPPVSTDHLDKLRLSALSYRQWLISLAADMTALSNTTKSNDELITWFTDEISELFARSQFG